MSNRRQRCRQQRLGDSGGRGEGCSGGGGAHQLHHNRELVVLDDTAEVIDDVRVVHGLQQADLIHALVALTRAHVEHLPAKRIQVRRRATARKTARHARTPESA